MTSIDEAVKAALLGTEVPYLSASSRTIDIRVFVRRVIDRGVASGHLIPKDQLEMVPQEVLTVRDLMGNVSHISREPMYVLKGDS